MSQSDSGTSIIELARAAGARKLLLKKMVLQCIEDRNPASDSGRLERRATLQQISPALPPSPPPIVGSEAPTLLSPEIESRLAHIEAHINRARDPVSTSNPSIEDLAARVHSIDQKIEVLRTDLRSLDLSDTLINEQVKSFVQIFASLGRDAHKLSQTVDALALEFRKSQAQMPDATALQNRLTHLESGMARAIDLLQSPDHGLTDLSHLRDRFSRIETDLGRVMKRIEDLPAPPVDADLLAEREATAKVLASITRLIEGMKSSDRIQVELGDSRI
jgi:capsule polysaccharide export protein KpsE/RkpR